MKTQKPCGAFATQLKQDPSVEHIVSAQLSTRETVIPVNIALDMGTGFEDRLHLKGSKDQNNEIELPENNEPCRRCASCDSKREWF